MSASRGSTPADTASITSHTSTPAASGYVPMKRVTELSDDDSSDNDAASDEGDVYLKMKQRLLGKKQEEHVKTVKEKEDRSPDTPKRRDQRRSPIPTARHSKQKSPSPIVSSAARSASARSSRSPSDSESDVPLAPKRKRNTLFAQDSGSEKSTHGASASEDDLPSIAATQARVKELVARRRAERLEKEAADKEKAAARARDTPKNRRTEEHDSDQGEGDAEAEKDIDDKLTQQARPTRKASKKAIEEMNKETQRMARNMQLTHQAKVKKKFSVADFAAQFMAKPRDADTSFAAAPASSSVPPSSDHEQDAHVGTPPSSPPSEGEVPLLGKSIFAAPIAQEAQLNVEDEDEDEDEELPTLEEILSQTLRQKDKGKALMPANAPSPPKATLPEPASRRARIAHLMKSKAHDSSSDDDLDVVKPRFPVFDAVKPRKANESRADHNLRLLANLNSHEPAPRKGKTRPSITAGQLDVQLRRAAAEQAKTERDEKIAALRAKGVIVQTQEERERDLVEIEDLLEKARIEAQELRKKEKAAAKREGGEMGAEVSDDESGDEDWVEDGERNVEEGDDEGEGDESEVAELSGSEDEEVEGEEDGKEEKADGGMFDAAAEEADSEGEDEDEQDGDAHEEVVMDLDEEPATTTPAPTFRRPQRKKLVIEDDDDDDEAQESNEVTVASSQPLPAGDESTQVDDVAAAFGFHAGPGAFMSPSQMFAGTMAASQTQRDSQMYATPTLREEDSMDLFNHMVPSAEPRMTPGMYGDDSQGVMLPDDQDANKTPTAQMPAFSLGLSNATVESPAMSRFSQTLPSPSQDAGYGFNDSPLVRPIELPQSTVETVVLAVPESPIAPRKSRLQQRRRVVDEESVDGEAKADESAALSKATAFDVMRKAATKPAEPDFDKKKSNAKNMVDEQAEESEDEYAGLGGASGDESAGEEDEADRQMIDESDVKVDERKLAAYYAEKERLSNEAQTSKLYKDLMSGALRRRGDAFDLDSDEDEQIAERRRRKQREEARKRRLLLGDEKLGKFDGNDKKEAFLRAIEDRNEEEAAIDLLDGKDRDAEEASAESQDPSQQTSQADSASQTLQPVSGNALKRKATDAIDSAPKRPALATPNAAFLKPASFAEVRESVSFLIDEPHAQERIVPLSDSEHSDDDSDEHMAEPAAPVERAPYSARRTPAKPAVAVVDRLLLRQTSSTIASDGAGMAFVSRSNSLSFKAPSLLRRATTSASAAGSMGPPALKRGGSSTSGAGGLGGKDEGVRRGGGKKSSINWAAREAERRAVVDKVEKRRKEDVRKVAGMRRGSSLMGMGGGFE